MAELENVTDALDRIKRISKRGTEYWMGRDLQPVLGYERWENFREVIEKARMACESSGHDPDRHFLDTTKAIQSGNGAQIARSDFFLSREACYLIAMNGDPRKAEIGTAQAYFAVQTRRQEIQDEAHATEKRLELRNRLKEANTKLSSAAHRAGVKRFDVFHDAGYRGLYGGLGRKEIKSKKGIAATEDLLDCIDRTELAANEFRATQAEAKLKREHVSTESVAINTHFNVGQEVRKTIGKIGGDMPETLPALPSIKNLAAKRKRLEKKPVKQLPPGS